MDDVTFLTRPGDVEPPPVPDEPETDQPTTGQPPADEPPGALRRFGRWASSGAIEPSGAAGDAQPEPPRAPRPSGPSSRDRGRLRRRLRYLRRARELGFRDLGGLVFDQYRFRQSNPDLLAGKLQALHVVDSELRALEHILDDSRDFTDLREPGISVCPHCAALHSSDARYCEMCGRPQTGEVDTEPDAPPPS